MSTKVNEILALVADLSNRCRELEEHNAKLEEELRRKQAGLAGLRHLMAEEKAAHEMELAEAKGKLRTTKRKLAKREQLVESQRKMARAKVTLDVGGTRFTTTLATLGDSVLAALFYGGQDLESGEDGAVFIDRDPWAFGAILQWLRTKILPPVSTETQRQTLKVEATHYGLDTLAQELEKLQFEKPNSPDTPDAPRTRDATVSQTKGTENNQDKPHKLMKIGAEQFLNLINRRTLPTLRLNSCDLRGFDFYGLDLCQANLHGCNLDGVDLRHAKLSGACLAECSLRGAFLSNADLSRANCQRADLADAKMKQTSLVCADLTGASMARSVLDHANFEGAVLNSADMTMVKAKGATFKGASLASANLEQAHLENCVLDGADMSGARHQSEALPPIAQPKSREAIK